MKVDPSTQVSIRFDPVSTATQAVLNAIDDVSYDLSIRDQSYPNVIAAAVLRAVANQPQEVPVHVQDESYWPYVNGIEQMQEFLERLAAELEGSI